MERVVVRLQHALGERDHFLDFEPRDVGAPDLGQIIVREIRVPSPREPAVDSLDLSAPYVNLYEEPCTSLLEMWPDFIIRVMPLDAEKERGEASRPRIVSGLEQAS